MSNNKKTQKGKKDVKVVVIIEKDSPHAGKNLTVKRKWNKEEKEYKYEGYIWDVWVQIEEKLNPKYNFKYTFLENSDMDQIVEDVANGKYDMCVGAFRRTAQRENLINYSAPIILDATSVIYYRGQFDEMNEFSQLVYKMRYHISGIVFFGIVFGLILFFLDKGRIRHQTHGKKTNKSILFLFRSILTGISSLFGEMGYLSERATLNIKSIFIIIVLMTVASIFLMYIQGEITKILVEKPSFSITQENIRGKTILGLEGTAIVKELKKYGAKIIELENKSMEDMIDIYMKSIILNKGNYKKAQKYDGCACSYLAGYPYTLVNNLAISPDFGYNTVCFILAEPSNGGITGLRDNVNVAISQLKDSLELKKLCLNYFGDVEAVPICD